MRFGIVWREAYELHRTQRAKVRIIEVVHECCSVVWTEIDFPYVVRFSRIITMMSGLGVKILMLQS
jgi:hypothetical protein